MTSSHVSSVGSPVGRLRDVEVVDHDGPLVEQRRLVDEVVHPRAAALGLARPEVAEEQAELAAVGVEHLEHAHVRVVADEVVALGEREPVELGRRAEHAVGQHPLQLQVGAQDRVVERAALLLDLLGVELPSPTAPAGRPGWSCPSASARSAPSARALATAAGREPLEDVRDGLRRSSRSRRRRRTRRGARTRAAGRARRACGPGSSSVARVSCGAGRAAAGRRAEDPLAQAAVAQRGQRRLLRRQRELEEPAVLVAAVARRLRRGGAGVLGAARPARPRR